LNVEEPDPRRQDGAGRERSDPQDEGGPGGCRRAWRSGRQQTRGGSGGSGREEMRRRHERRQRQVDTNRRCRHGYRREDATAALVPMREHDHACRCVRDWARRAGTGGNPRHDGRSASQACLGTAAERCLLLRTVRRRRNRGRDSLTQSDAGGGRRRSAREPHRHDGGDTAEHRPLHGPSVARRVGRPDSASETRALRPIPRADRSRRPRPEAPARPRARHGPVRRRIVGVIHAGTEIGVAEILVLMVEAERVADLLTDHQRAPRGRVVPDLAVGVTSRPALRDPGAPFRKDAPRRSSRVHRPAERWRRVRRSGCRPRPLQSLTPG
jgi:hypothetical protein